MQSSITQKAVDYQVDFTDCQRLERLLEKLSLSWETLKMIERILRMLQNLNNRGKPLQDHERRDSQENLHQLSRLISRVQAYMRTASALQRCAERTSILVSLLSLVHELDSEGITVVNKALGLPNGGSIAYQHESPCANRHGRQLAARAFEMYLRRN